MLRSVHRTGTVHSAGETSPNAGCEPVAVSQEGDGSASVIGEVAVGLEKWAQRPEIFRRQNLQGLTATNYGESEGSQGQQGCLAWEN